MLNDRKIAITRDVKFVDVNRNLREDGDINILSQTKCGTTELIKKNEDSDVDEVEVAHEPKDSDNGEKMIVSRQGKGKPRIL